MKPTKRYCDNEHDTDCVVRDGQRVRVHTMMMDSACDCGTTTHDTAPAISDGNRQLLEAERLRAEEIQRHVDYFNGQRECREAQDRERSPEYHAMRRDLESAWQGVQS